MTKPISPSQVAGQKAKTFPGFVFEAFNELIAEKFTAGSAQINQDDAVNRILSKSDNLSRHQIFELGYLNVEEVYREQGWRVDYHKAFAFMGDNGPSYFLFSSK